MLVLALLMLEMLVVLVLVVFLFSCCCWWWWWKGGEVLVGRLMALAWWGCGIWVGVIVGLGGVCVVTVLNFRFFSKFFYSSIFIVCLIRQLDWSWPWWYIVYIRNRQKIWNIWKAQWKHAYLTFWYAANGLAPNTNKQIVTSMQLPLVLWTKMQLAMLEIKKMHNKIYGNVWILSFCLIFPITPIVSIII